LLVRLNVSPRLGAHTLLLVQGRAFPTCAKVVMISVAGRGGGNAKKRDVRVSSREKGRS